MAEFDYTALDRSGKKVAGTLTAPDRPQALKQIAERSLAPLSVSARNAPAPAAKAASGTSSRRGRVSQASVEAFTRQLANLLSAGVPLSRALGLLSREASHAAARTQWQAIHDDVVGGMSLADALAQYPRSFPKVYVAMVRAGETGGFLDVVLEQIADFRAREQDLKGRVKAAMVYPVVLAVLATGVMIFLMTYFIPRFSAIFADLGSALPWLTDVVVRISNFILAKWPFILVAAVLVVVAVRRALATSGGRRFFERTLLGLPMVGRVLAHFSLVRFCRMLGTLLGAGVPLVTALRVSREALGNQTLADTVTHALEDVRRGTPLARSLASSKRLFPPEVIEMVSVAEESGRLDKEMVRLAASYENELDRRLRTLVALAEPALLFVMAAVVGTVVISMMLPVFTLQDLIR